MLLARVLVNRYRAVWKQNVTLVIYGLLKELVRALNLILGYFLHDQMILLLNYTVKVLIVFDFLLTSQCNLFAYYQNLNSISVKRS